MQVFVPVYNVLYCFMQTHKENKLIAINTSVDQVSFAIQDRLKALKHENN